MRSGRLNGSADALVRGGIPAADVSPTDSGRPGGELHLATRCACPKGCTNPSLQPWDEMCAQCYAHGC